MAETRKFFCYGFNIGRSKDIWVQYVSIEPGGVTAVDCGRYESIDFVAVSADFEMGDAWGSNLPGFGHSYAYDKGEPARLALLHARHIFWRVFLGGAQGSVPEPPHRD